MSINYSIFFNNWACHFKKELCKHATQPVHKKTFIKKKKNQIYEIKTNANVIDYNVNYAFIATEFFQYSTFSFEMLSTHSKSAFWRYLRELGLDFKLCYGWNDWCIYT